MSDGTLLTALYETGLRPMRDRPLPAMPANLYAYVCRVSGRQQVWLCLLTLLVFPLTLAPLELQRRIVDGAVEGSSLDTLLVLGGLYFGVVLVHGGLKYIRNLYVDRVREGVTRLLRLRMADSETFGVEAEDGTKQSIITAEAEKVGGFVSESIAFPFLQAGIVASVMGYMLVVEPLMAAVALGFFFPSLIAVFAFQPVLDRLSGHKIGALRTLAQGVLAGASAGDGRAEDGEPERCVERIYGLGMRFAVVKHAMKFINNFFGHLGPLGVLMVGGWLVLEGRTEIGTVVAFLSGFERMTDPARELLGFYRRLSLMRVQYRLVRQTGDSAEPAG